MSLDGIARDGGPAVEFADYREPESWRRDRTGANIISGVLRRGRQRCLAALAALEPFHPVAGVCSFRLDSKSKAVHKNGEPQEGRPLRLSRGSIVFASVHLPAAL